MFKLVVLFSTLALAAAKPGVVLPLGWQGTWPAVSSVSQYSVHGSSVLPYHSGVYSPYWSGAVLSQLPHHPAVALDPVRGVPLDTPEVVAARAAHYQTKALAGVHHLAKRSAVVAPVTHGFVSPVTYSATPYVSTYSSPYWSSWSSPWVSPVGYSAVVPKALSVHPY